MAEKCPCLTDVQSCCACVSMHCDECHKPKQSKFVQGRFCSNCGRPLKAELTQAYVPKSEVEELQHKYELAVAEREANVKGFAEELLKLKTEVAREIIDDLANKGLLNIEAWAIEEFKKKYTEEKLNEKIRT